MRRIGNLFAVYTFIGLALFALGGQANAQQGNERQIRDIIRSLNSEIDDFQYGLDYQLRSSSADRQDIDDVSQSVRNLREKVENFEENLAKRSENRDDVADIVTAARDVDGFLKRKRQDRRIETDWASVRNLIDRLAANYNLTPDWSGRTSSVPPALGDDDNYPGSNNFPTPVRSGISSNALNGTYQLDVSKSESAADIVAGTKVQASQSGDLRSRLEAPEQIAIEVRGNQVTLASSKASPITFIADGREKTETSGGRTIRVKATLRGDELTVSSLGGETDYTVTFVPADNGRTLKVTRRITTEYLSETVFAESVYNRSDSSARLGIDSNSIGNTQDDGTFSSNDPNDRPGSNNPNPSLGYGRTGDFIVPNGTVVTGILDNEINTKVSQNSDRFRMTVQSPNEFRGATIEGYISGVGRSGQISGRSNITFNFERITLRNGRSYDFGGFLQGVRDQNGKVVKVDTEGTARGDSQTNETAKRGGIGAGLGALIGAIAGGGKGALIGAILGGGAGAGSVIYQGRDDIQLLKGSTITVQASSPIRRDQPLSEN